MPLTERLRRLAWLALALLAVTPPRGHQASMPSWHQMHQRPLKIYVYNISGMIGCGGAFTCAFTNRIVNSRYYTTDGENADYYYMPILHGVGNPQKVGEGRSDLVPSTTHPDRLRSNALALAYCSPPPSGGDFHLSELTMCEHCISATPGLSLDGWASASVVFVLCKLIVLKQTRCCLLPP